MKEKTHQKLADALTLEAKQKKLHLAQKQHEIEGLQQKRKDLSASVASEWALIKNIPGLRGVFDSFLKDIQKQQDQLQTRLKKNLKELDAMHQDIQALFLKAKPHTLAVEKSKAEKAERRTKADERLLDDTRTRHKPKR